MKSEPGEFSMDDLLNMPEQTEHWDGVRNYQARNFMMGMEPGDGVLFYHSVTQPVGIAGIAKVVKKAYPDFTAWDEKDKHYDPKSTEEKPRWFMVDIQAVQKLDEVIPLARLKESPELEGMEVTRKGSRLSVQPVSEEHWTFILEKLAGLQGLEV
jgi:predicted RNA-binding protein with PUA-like domain